MGTTSPPLRLRPNHRWRCRAIVSLVLAAALLTSTASAAAQGTDPVIGDGQAPGAGVGTTVEAAQAVDPAIASYAAEYGVTEAEAVLRLNRIQPMQEILASIRELESARVAGWGINHVGTFAGWVWLTGDEHPKPASEAIASIHDDIEIRTGAKHTITELLDAQDRFGNGSSLGPVGRVDDQATVAGYSAAVTFTAPDMNTNSLHIGIDPALLRQTESSALPSTVGGVGPAGNTGAPTTATNAELAALAAQMTAAYKGQIGTAYAIVDGRGHADLAMFDGGRAMSTCTSGFAARQRSTGTYGIITAGHCSSSQRMNGVSLPWVTGYKSTTADAQFHRVPSGSKHQLKSRFVYNQSSPPKTRVVRGAESWSGMLGDYVCHAGKNTGSTCGTVINIYFRPTNSGACLDSEFGASVRCAARFVRVYGDDLMGCEGDSGGPWYRGPTAYGILKGGTDASNCTATGKTLWFSAINYVEDFLGVDILIANNVTIG